MPGRKAALFAAAATFICACGTSGPPPLTSTTTLISDATRSLLNAGSYHMVVSYTSGDATFQSDLHVALPSDVTGWVTENGVTLQVLQTSGKLYVQGQDYVAEYGGSYEGRLFGSRWILATPNLLRTTPLDVNQLAAIPEALLQRNFNGKRIDHVSVGTGSTAERTGQMPSAADSTAELTGDFGAMYITEQPPHRLVKLETATGFVPIPGYSGISMELLDYNVPVTVTVPQDFADPNDPTTLPPQFEVLGKWDVQGCDYTSCGFKAVVINRGGAFVTPTPSTFTFTLTHTNNTIIDKCSGTIAAVVAQGSATIACRITSAAWQNFAYNGGSYYADLSIDNPPYDG